MRAAAQPKKCKKSHSGNKDLHKMGRGRLANYRECAGCGEIYTVDMLLRAARAEVGSVVGPAAQKVEPRFHFWQVDQLKKTI